LTKKKKVSILYVNISRGKKMKKKNRIIAMPDRSLIGFFKNVFSRNNIFFKIFILVYMVGFVISYILKLQQCTSEHISELTYIFYAYVGMTFLFPFVATYLHSLLNGYQRLISLIVKTNKKIKIYFTQRDYEKWYSTYIFNFKIIKRKPILISYNKEFSCYYAECKELNIFESGRTLEKAIENLLKFMEDDLEAWEGTPIEEVSEKGREHLKLLREYMKELTLDI